MTWASDPRYVPSSHNVRAKAVIERDGSILLIKIHDAGFVHYSLPGGGVEPGESVQEGLVREVREEAACDVAVGDLLFAHEYEPLPTADIDGDAPALLLVFRCNLAAGIEPSMPKVPDRLQVGVDWVKLDELGIRFPLFSPIAAKNIVTALRRPGQQTLFTSHRRG